MPIPTSTNPLSYEIVDANNFVLFFTAFFWAIVFGFIMALLIRALYWLWG